MEFGIDVKLQQCRQHQVLQEKKKRFNKKNILIKKLKKKGGELSSPLGAMDSNPSSQKLSSEGAL